MGPFSRRRTNAGVAHDTNDESAATFMHQGMGAIVVNVGDRLEFTCDPVHKKSRPVME